MKRSMVVAMAFLCLASSSVIHAADIIWVHQGRGGGETLSWEDDLWRALIENQGHTIVSHAGYDDLETLSQEDADARVAEFNAADLVIVSRDSNSGDYNDPSEHIFYTDGFETPMIVMTPYLLRSSRWDMVNNTSIVDAMNPMVPADAGHPLFEGVELNADGQLDFWSQLGPDDQIDLLGTTDYGFAEVLATEAETDFPWIAYWDGESNFGDFYDGSGTFASGPRLFLSAGSDDDPNTWGEKNITPAGDKIVLNAIAWLTGDPGNPIDVCVPNNGDIDGNGTVEFADFLVLSANFGQAGDAASGDTDCNGEVDFADFLALSANFGQTVGQAAAVPEPNALTLLGAGFLAVTCLRKRR